MHGDFLLRAHVLLRGKALLASLFNGQLALQSDAHQNFMYSSNL
jgi:hypothetical protein